MIKNTIKKYNKLSIQIKASFFYLICSFLQKGISIITTPIFTRLLTTSEYGRYNVFNSWLGIVSIFVTLQLYFGVYEQGLIKFDNERNVFSSTLQGLTLTMVSGWTIIYLLFRRFWNDVFSLTTIQMLAMLLMVWTSAVYNFWAAEQRVKLSYKKLVFTTVLVTIAKPVIGIVFVIYSQDKVTARILGLALVELVAYFWMFIAQMKHGKRFFSGKFWKYVICFNLPLVPHYLSQTVLSGADRIMIKKMINDDAAGIYSLAYSISMVMVLFNTALSQTINPWILQKIKDKKIKETETVAYIALIIIALANLLLIAFAPEAVALFAPVNYIDAIWIIPPVAMSVYFMYAYNIFSNIEFYYEKTKFIMVASIIAAFLNIVLNYYFIKKYGYFAAGYTTLFCYIIFALMHYIFMKKICRAKMNGEIVYDSKILAAITIVFLALGFIYLFSYKYIFLRYSISAVIFLAIIIKRKYILRHFKIVLENRKKS